MFKPVITLYNGDSLVVKEGEAVKVRVLHAGDARKGAENEPVTIYMREQTREMA